MPPLMDYTFEQLCAENGWEIMARGADLVDAQLTRWAGSAIIAKRDGHTVSYALLAITCDHETAEIMDGGQVAFGSFSEACAASDKWVDNALAPGVYAGVHSKRWHQANAPYAHAGHSLAWEAADAFEHEIEQEALNARADQVQAIEQAAKQQGRTASSLMLE